MYGQGSEFKVCSFTLHWAFSHLLSVSRQAVRKGCVKSLSRSSVTVSFPVSSCSILMLLAPWRTATSGSEQLAFSVCLLLRLLLLLIINHAYGVFKDPFPSQWASSQVSRAAADFHELPHPRTAALIVLDGRNDTYSYCSYLRFSRLWINTSLLYAFGQFPLVVFDNFFQFYNCFWGEDWAPGSPTLESDLPAGQPATNFTYICVCYYLGVVSTLSLLYYFSLSETFCG